MELLKVHKDLRFIINDDILSLDGSTDVFIAVLDSYDLDKAQPMLHLQRVTKPNKAGEVKAIKGGIMIPTKNVAQLKAIIDKMYLTIVKNEMNR